jgi:O-antigen/teichoic acid export membrane protein
VSSKPLTQQAAWSALAAVVTRGGSLVLVLVLVRLLDQNEYGGYALGLSTAVVFGTVFSSPLAVIISRAASIDCLGRLTLTSRNKSALLLLGGMVAVLPAMILYFGAPWIGAVITAGAIDGQLRAASWYVFSQAAFTMMSAVLIGRQQFVTLATVNVTYWCTAIIAAMALAENSPVNGPYIALVQGAAAAIVLMVPSAVDWVRQEAARSPGSADGLHARAGRELLDQYVPQFLAGVLVVPIPWASLVILAYHLSQTAVAEYQAQLTLSGVASFVPSVVAQVALPFYSRRSSSGYGRAGATLIALSAFLSLPAALIVSIGPEWIASVALGADYRESANVLVLLTFAAVLSGVSSVIGQQFAGYGRMWPMSFSNAFASLLTLGLAAVLVPLWGVEGLAWAQIIKGILHLLVMAWMSQRLLASPTLESAVRAISITTVSLIGALALSAPMRLILLAGIGLIVARGVQSRLRLMRDGEADV